MRPASAEPTKSFEEKRCPTLGGGKGFARKEWLDLVITGSDIANIIESMI